MNLERNFVKENRCQTAGPACCRRRKELEDSHIAKSIREDRWVLSLYFPDSLVLGLCKQQVIFFEEGGVNPRQVAVAGHSLSARVVLVSIPGFPCGIPQSMKLILATTFSED